MRFKDSFEVEFPQNQVTLIAGENGAGKTSILDALCVCLYGRTFRTSGRASSGFLSINDLVNHESNKATIRVEFENHGHNYVVSREITGNDSDGKLLEDGESKAIGRHVYVYVKNRAIGLDWEGFRKSTVVLQGEMSSLTDLDPGPRKKAFTELFGLDRYFVYEQLAKEKTHGKGSDIQATEEANKILQDDIQKIPAVKEEIKQVMKKVKTLEKNIDKLNKAVELRKINVETLESGHSEYIKQKEKADGIKLQIDGAKRTVNKNRDEFRRLLSIQSRFGALENSYTTYSLLEKKISKLHPTKAKYDNLSNKIARYNTALGGKKDNLSDTVSQMKEARHVILKLQKQIPTSSELEKIKRDLKKSRDEEKLFIGRSNSLLEQIKQISKSISELEKKRDQVKGKDKCPVCLQKITDPQHVTKHYNDEISALVSKKPGLEKEQTSTLQMIKKLSEKIKHLDGLRHELERGASKTEQVRRELGRVAGLDKKKKSIGKQIDKIKKDIHYLIQKCDKLGFDPVGYNRLDVKVKQFRKNRIAELYTNAKTELKRLTIVKQELEISQRTLSDLFDKKKTLQIELTRLTKIEKKYTKAKQLLERSKEKFHYDNGLLARESEREKQAKDRLKELEDKEQKLAKNLKQIGHLKEEIITLEELRDIFKNIPENILRRLRPFIEKEGTDIINELSNSEITALNIDEGTLNVAATTNGEVRPIHYYSGGQKTRINMALRVAISRILSKMPQTQEHTFAIMQTLFIDEGDFGNLDEAGIRDAVNVIRNLTKEFSRVILISHVDNIREIFHGHTVEVQKIGPNDSTIKTIANASAMQVEL